MNVKSDSVLHEAAILIQQGKMESAVRTLEDVYIHDYENRTLNFALRGCKFWSQSFQETDPGDFFQQGEILISRWKQFKQIIKREQNPNEEIIYSFKKAVYSLALQNYLQAKDNGDSKLKAELLRKRGLCYKKLGTYEQALNLLTQARALMPENASYLAEMADCYDLCGENKNAKVLFREAFYKNPSEIDLTFIDSPMIKTMIQEVESRGFSGNELLEWIPVFAYLRGVFNIRRTLSSLEYGHLRQEIAALEHETNVAQQNIRTLKPRLLNHYFWLLDWNLMQKASGREINEVLLKIKILDDGIFSLLKKS